MVLLTKSGLELPAAQVHTSDYGSACCLLVLPNPFLHSFYLAIQSPVYCVLWGFYWPGGGLEYVFAEIREVPVDICIQPVKARQNGSPALKYINHIPVLLLFAGLLGGYLMLPVINEEFKQYQCQYQPLSWYPAVNWTLRLWLSSPSGQQFSNFPFTLYSIYLKTYVFKLATWNTWQCKVNGCTWCS